MRAERGFLADLLWSDRGEEQARASLRQELSLLRRALTDGVIGSNRQHLWLDPSSVEIEISGVDTFLKGFEDWLREMRTTEQVPTAKDGAPDVALIFSRCVATFGYFDEPELAAEALGKLKAVQPDFDEAYVRETYPYARPQDLDVLLQRLQKAGAFDGGV